MFAKAILILIGLTFIAFGLAFLSAPAALAPLLGIQAPSAHALVELRAFYGGLELMLGLVVLIAAGSERHVQLGLALATAICGSLALARAGAMVMTGTFSPPLLATLGIELGLAMLAATAWFVAPKTPVR